MNNQDIKDWVAGYISEFRARLATIDPAKQRIGSNLEDFSSPIQVLVVSVSHEEGSAHTLLVGFHLRSQPDGAVYVLGPMEPTDIPKDVAAFLDDEIWAEEVETARFLIDEGERSLRSIIAKLVAQHLNRFDSLRVAAAYGVVKNDPRIGSRIMTPPDGFMWELHGDFTRLDPKQLVADRVEDIAPLSKTASPVDQADQPARPEPLQRFGALFYPPVRIGRRLQLSVDDILKRKNFFRFGPRQQAFEGTCRGDPVIAFEDGLLTVQTGNRGEALETLNIVMALTWMSGIADTRTVRDSELFDLRINPDHPENIQESVQLSSLRNLPVFTDQAPTMWGGVTPLIEVEQLEGVLQGADGIARDRDLAFQLLMIHDGYTSLQEADYRQAYIDGWLVIENWILVTWRDILSSGGRSAKAIKKLEDERNWTAGVMSETLQLTGRITDKQLGQIIKWRKLRNDIVHNGLSPSDDDAKGVIDFGLVLLRADSES